MGGIMLYGDADIIAIDSLYSNEIERSFEEMSLSVDEIWPKMTLSPVCLFRFNGPAYLYNHPDPPSGFKKITDKLYVGKQEDLQLFGATQMVINNVLTAIVDYGAEYYLDNEEAFAELFHEMHHVYQQNYLEQFDFDNPATLLTYPENPENDAIKLYEQQTLYLLCFEEDAERFNDLLNQFYSCRLERAGIIGDYVDYEKTVENLEGPAFYCEYMFYNHLNTLTTVQKNNYNHKHFFAILNTPFYGRQSLRMRHLAAGMAMCYILDRYNDSWKVQFYSQSESLYDFFISHFKIKKTPLNISKDNVAICQYHTDQIKQQHERNYDDFMSQSGTKIILDFVNIPQFRGFDPMNAEAINDSTVLHKTLLKLTNGKGDELYLNNHKAITVFDDIIWNTKQVILFVDKDVIEITDDNITVEQPGLNLTWKGELKNYINDSCYFDCH